MADVKEFMRQLYGEKGFKKDTGWGHDGEFRSRECDNPKIEDITTGARFDADGPLMRIYYSLEFVLLQALFFCLFSFFMIFYI